jgi:hypothetical protein
MPVEWLTTPFGIAGTICLCAGSRPRQDWRVKPFSLPDPTERTSHEQKNHADPYADPPVPALPPSDVELDLERAALVVVDPQIDFLSPDGVAWGAFGESITHHGTVPNIGRLFAAASQAGLPIVISPHYYYPHDHQWEFAAPGERLMYKLHMFDRPGALSLEGFSGSGADRMPEFKESIEDGKTIVCSPHKIAGPQTYDVIFHLHQIPLAGQCAVDDGNGSGKDRGSGKRIAPGI